MEYLVIRRSNLTDLETAIKHGIREDWKPQGGVCIGTEKYDIPHFYQAMIKEK